MKLFTLRTLLLMVIIVVLSGFTTGCNTMQGAGEDLEQAGKKIQDTAEDAAD